MELLGRRARGGREVGRGCGLSRAGNRGELGRGREMGRARWSGELAERGGGREGGQLAGEGKEGAGPRRRENGFPFFSRKILICTRIQFWI